MKTIDKLNFILNEIIGKDEWTKKYSAKFYQSFDPKKYRKIVKQLTDLFKKLNKGKLKKTVVYDFKESKIVKLNRLDMAVMNLLIDLGYTVNKDMYKTGIVYKGNKKKTIYDILNSFAKKSKEKMKETYKQKKIPQIKDQIDFIENLEQLNLIKKNRLDLSKLSIYKNKNQKIVFTYDIKAIASQSTKVGWTSCMNLDDGQFADTVGGGASEGAFIAYLVKPGDEFTLKHPVGRVLFKPYEGMSTGNLYWMADISYGGVPSSFKTEAQKIVNKIQGDVPKETDLYNITSKTYIDDLEDDIVNLKGIEKKIYDDPSEIANIDNPSEKLQLLSVKQDSDMIEHIKKPSEKVQLAAVKKDGDVIEYIKKPSEKVQLAAVKQIGYAIEHIKKPSEKVQLAAVKKDGDVIEYIKKPTEKVKKLAGK